MKLVAVRKVAVLSIGDASARGRGTRVINEINPFILRGLGGKREDQCANYVVFGATLASALAGLMRGIRANAR